jgi:hypothetical protein
MFCAYAKHTYVEESSLVLLFMILYAWPVIVLFSRCFAQAVHMHDFNTSLLLFVFYLL